ncbi:hypothetical protein [Shivajiella indica]|uniref:Polysaccharide (De)acetylase n=1 Tax=Shivajiella indica TaxID=872115 RepID=A0ABW5BAZ1_9BACT
MKEFLKKHLINFRGKRINEKLLIIESDDWGAIRIPNKRVQKELFSLGLIREADPFSKFDCLESRDDYKALFEVLGKFKDNYGNQAVLTANMVMGNPDFVQIEKSGFKQYAYEHFSRTYRSYYPEQSTFETLVSGIEKGFIYPQFHAREHLNVQRWMDKLQAGDPAFRKAFEYRCFAIDDKDKSNPRANIMATYDYQNSDELTTIQNSIEEGFQLFESTFGFKSLTHIAPCYVWNEAIEKQVADLGVIGIQGSKFQQFNLPSGIRYQRVWRYMGQKNNYQQVYTVRNVLFEPALNPKINWVDKALESISIAFFWGKPAVIGSHRINYVGGLSVENRCNSLAQLEELLHKVLKKWPDIRFINAEKLAKKMINA